MWQFSGPDIFTTLTGRDVFKLTDNVIEVVNWQGITSKINAQTKRRNWNNIFALWMSAADEGHKRAQFYVGTCYVKQDFKKAVQWLRLAATKGDTEAQRDLGYCYFYGQGVKEDSGRAIYWYKKAAAKADPKALYNLGLCYKEGEGVRQSYRWAKHYFEKAKELGHIKAAKQLSHLSR